MSETSAPAVHAPPWYAMPLHALRILAACAVPLLLWFTVGRVVRWALLLLAATISHGSWYQARLVLVMFLFTIIVMVSLATTVGMLYVLRGALLETQARRAEDSSGESALNALNRTALIFSGLYLTWGFVVQDAKDFAAIDLARDPLDMLTSAFAQEESTSMQGLYGMDFKVSLATMGVAYLLKTYFGRLHEARGGRFSGIATTFAELAFAFYGINALFEITGGRSEWIEGRAAVTGWREWSGQLGESVPGWTLLGEIWPYVVDGLVLPLVWLTVGILVYGAYAEDTRTTIRGTPLEAAANRLNETHSLTRAALAKLTDGFTSRWIPLLNSLRLTLKGGAPLFGLFALCYVGLRYAGDYLERAGFYLAGSNEPYQWILAEVPIFFVSELVVTVLSMCLIAATFDIAATKARAAEAMKQKAPEDRTLSAQES